jgi:hypothetical protein
VRRGGLFPADLHGLAAGVTKFERAGRSVYTAEEYLLDYDADFGIDSKTPEPELFSDGLAAVCDGGKWATSRPTGSSRSLFL